ncbi:hypothetical protein ACN9MU_06620 [Pseudoduganella sp. R-32]|uniref:hypothetical protein n=1 Tax=Pseudoduganella sp. R-32 TaxID=3404061 RepID=UPI003CF4DC55
MQPPTTLDERFAFIAALQYRLKPESLWVTDFLAQRLTDVEWTFCGGEKENAATAKLCAEYSRDILQAMHPDKVDFAESLQLVGISAAAQEEVRDLFVLDASMDAVPVTTQQACAAVSAFFRLVYARDFS